MPMLERALKILRLRILRLLRWKANDSQRMDVLYESSQAIAICVRVGRLTRPGSSALYPEECLERAQCQPAVTNGPPMVA